MGLMVWFWVVFYSVGFWVGVYGVKVLGWSSWCLDFGWGL